METRVLEIRYIGNTKPYPAQDERLAFGHDGEKWSAIFPESVLISWFAGTEVDPTQKQTLYGVLEVSRDATQDEIRAAFRTKARSWHTDLNHMYDNQTSNSAFIRAKEAYDVLSNADKRARYDAGLALEASTIKRKYVGKTVPMKPGDTTFRPTKRCGYVLAEGQDNERGQFVVSNILEWDPITNDQGKILVSTWEHGAQRYQEVWR